jgi:alanine racemase
MNLSSRVASKKVKIGSKICVISADPSAINNYLALASCSDTIGYEVLVGIASNIRRKII